jgi:hypothetical protein
MKKIYSYTDFALASQAHLNHDNDHGDNALNEGLGFLGRLNPVTIISSAVETVRDYLTWNKESKDPRFRKVRTVTDFLSDPKYAEKFGEVNDTKTTIEGKVRDLEDESKKQYSELKYQLAEEVQELLSEWRLKKEEVIEMLYVDYYQEHGSELYDDVKDVVEFLRTSRWYSKNRHKLEPLLNRFKEILGKSDIKKTLDNLL